MSLLSLAKAIYGRQTNSSKYSYVLIPKTYVNLLTSMAKETLQT